jgi:hypothetical protein
LISLTRFVGGSEQEDSMISLTFPDGATRQVEAGVSARVVAASIS